MKTKGKYFKMLVLILLICCCLSSVYSVDTQAATEIKLFEAKNQEDIEKYIEEAAQLSQTTNAQITIELVEDTYYLTKPIEIRGDSFGSHVVSIHFKNKEGKTPLVTGLSEMQGSSFAKVDGKEYYSYTIPADADNQYPQFRDLYVNGERFTLAKSTDYVFSKNRKDDGSNCFYVDKNALKNVSSDDVSPLEIDIDMLWLHKQYRVDTVTKKEIYGFAYADTEISLVEEDFWSFPETATETNQSIKALQNFTYRFKNHLAFLDEPGEFFYDETTGTIYLYPYSDTDMETATVGYPLVERLFLLDGASNITFEGISFTGTTYNFTTNYGYNAYQGGYHMWPEKSAQRVTESDFGGDTEAFTAWRYDVATVGAIAGKNTENILVKNCSFDSLGTAGIDLKGTNSHVEVSGCSFTDLAMSAIYLGQNNQGFEKRQKNIVINNNYIYDVSREYRTFPGIISFQAEDVTITHNTIKKTPYSGIHLGWWTNPSVRGVEIAYNYFENCMYRGDDGGAIYVCGGSTTDTSDTTVMNHIYRNYVKCNGFSDYYTGLWGENVGIYLDNYSSNYSVYENVLTSYNSSIAEVRAIRNQDNADLATY